MTFCFCSACTRLCQPVYLRTVYVTVHTEKDRGQEVGDSLFKDFSCYFIFSFSVFLLIEWLEVKKCQKRCMTWLLFLFHILSVFSFWLWAEAVSTLNLKSHLLKLYSLFFLQYRFTLLCIFSSCVIGFMVSKKQKTKCPCPWAKLCIFSLFCSFLGRRRWDRHWKPFVPDGNSFPRIAQSLEKMTSQMTSLTMTVVMLTRANDLYYISFLIVYRNNIETVLTMWSSWKSCSQ